MEKNQPQFCWLLKLLEKNANTFQIMFNVKFQIPNMIMLKQSEIISWFQMEKNSIKQVNKESKDLSQVKDYYLNFLNRIQDPQNKQKYKNELFYIQMMKYGKTITRKVSKKDCKILISPLHQYQHYTNQWIKIFDCFPIQTEDNLKLFQISLLDGKVTVDIMKLDDIMVTEEDYKKKDLEKAKTKTVEQKNIQKCNSSLINQKCEKLIKSMKQYIDSKLQIYKLHSMKLDIIMDINQNIYLINADNLQIVGLDSKIPEPITYQIKPLPQKQFIKQNQPCEGYYCHNTEFFNHQKNNQFLFQENQNKWDKNNIITYKSLTLDILERSKTIERITQLCDITESQAKQINENILFDLRKFYDISNIYKGEFKYFKHINNLYKKVNLCQNCQNIYFNIDIIRSEQINTQEYILDDTVKQMIDNYFNNRSMVKTQMKKIESARIQNQIKDFDPIQSVKKRTVVKSFFNEESFNQIQMYDGQIQNGRNSLNQQRIITPKLYQIHKIKDQITFRVQSSIKKEHDASLSHRHHIDYNKNFRNKNKNFNRCQSSQQLNKDQFLKTYTDPQLNVINDNHDAQKQWILKKKQNNYNNQNNQEQEQSELCVSIRGISDRHRKLYY